jgi:hypothetical protein
MAPILGGADTRQRWYTVQKQMLLTFRLAHGNYQTISMIQGTCCEYFTWDLVKIRIFGSVEWECITLKTCRIQMDHLVTQKNVATSRLKAFIGNILGRDSSATWFHVA